MKKSIERKQRTASRKRKSEMDELHERNIEHVPFDISDINSPLWTRKGETHYEGFYLRNLNDFNIYHGEKDMSYDRTMEVMKAINRKFSRRFIGSSRPSLCSFVPCDKLHFWAK